MATMTDQEKVEIRALYEALLEGDTVLGFDEDREVGVISIVENRGGTIHMMPVAEIKTPLIMPVAIEE